MEMSFQERIAGFIESGFQTLYIATTERNRCEEELSVIAESLEMKFVTWDAIDGFTQYVNGNATSSGDCQDPLEALKAIDGEDAIFKKSKNIMFVFRNFHAFLEDPAIRQQFQNLYYGRRLSNIDRMCPIIIVSSILQIHPEIFTCITTTEYNLPNEKELTKIFNNVQANITIDESKPGAIATCDDELQARIIQALRGLTTIEAEHTLAYSLRVSRGFSSTIVETIENQKALALEKSEVLTYIPKERIETMDDIGGYEILKEFIRIRKLAYTKKAREMNIDLPRGIVLLGCPGTGKSVVGKVIAKDLGLPLVVLNVAAVFGSLIGESEKKIRSALATIDALDGAVVLIDEAEKALGGANDAAGDSGVSRRVFGAILTWLTEKRSRTFVVMTMNRTKGIPPEFLRKGRMDEIFFTDLPTAEERDAILRIHCRKRGIVVAAYSEKQWQDELVNATERYVGAELEQIVCDARFMAFEARQDGQPTLEELVKAAELIVPIADAEKENIEEIRKMCENRARSVSRASVVQTKRGRSVVIR